MTDITTFSGPNRFLSNFYPSPITVEGMQYPTVEHYYQSEKTLDELERLEIIQASTPGRAKRRGRYCTLRPDWELIKDGVMLDGLLVKFQSPSEFAILLNGTGNRHLEEGNYWHDNYFGNCACGQGKCIQPGENVLGQLLMIVRDLNRGGNN